MADMLLPGGPVMWPLLDNGAWFGWLLVWGGQGAFSSHWVQLPGSPPKEGYVLGLTFILKENYKGNTSTWPQLKSGGFDLSYLTTSLHGNFAWVPPRSCFSAQDPLDTKRSFTFNRKWMLLFNLSASCKWLHRAAPPPTLSCPLCSEMKLRLQRRARVSSRPHLPAQRGATGF